MLKSELMLIFYETNKKGGLERLLEDVQIVRQIGEHDHFLNDYIYGPKPSNDAREIQFNAWGFRLVQSLNGELIGYRFRCGGIDCFLSDATRDEFYDMVEKVCFYYDLDYVLLIEDEASKVYFNSDVNELFFEMKHDLEITN